MEETKRVISINGEDIKEIEELLEKLKTGEVQGILFASVDKDRAVTTYMSGHLNMSMSCYAFMNLQANLLEYIKTMNE
jgi:hypothetical protein